VLQKIQRPWRLRNWRSIPGNVLKMTVNSLFFVFT
jgi:hypothetical protein